MNALRAGVKWLVLVAGLATACRHGGTPGASPDPRAERSTRAERSPTVGDVAQHDPPPPAPPEPVPSPTSLPSAPGAMPAPDDPVFLNGVRLEPADLSELQAVLGQAPVPGRYWYDPRSGLWGLEAHGAAGVTRPGLRVPAPLPADAARGSSGVFVNDRQLTARELAVIAQLLGWDESSSGALAGRYVLDEQGRLYSIRGRYLGSLASAAPRARAQSTSPAPCAWLQLGAEPDILGRAVTINCD
jgi:hypothetical protein